MAVRVSRPNGNSIVTSVGDTGASKDKWAAVLWLAYLVCPNSVAHSSLNPVGNVNKNIFCQISE